MKKVMFVVLSLLIATAAFALESGPSNTTGYTKTVAVGGPGTVSTPFGIAFQTWDVPTGGVPSYGVNSSDPSDIVGDQTFCGTLALTADRILRQDNGQFAIRNSASACAWTQLLETNHNMLPGRAYWYQNRTGANRDLIIAGEANITTTYGTVTITAPAVNGQTVSTPYSWRDPRSRDRADLQLLASGFTGGTISTSDRVLAQVGGAFFYRRTSDNTWQGTQLTVEPGFAYWIQRKWVGAYNYTYDPTSNADLTMPGGGTKIATSKSDLQKIEPVKVKATSKGASN